MNTGTINERDFTANGFCKRVYAIVFLLHITS
jgi:hypothetical protein